MNENIADYEHLHEFETEYATIVVQPVDGSPPYETQGRFCKTCPAMIIQEGGFDVIVTLSKVVPN